MRKRSILFWLVLLSTISGGPAFAQEQAHRGSWHICANPKLSDENKAACAKDMQNAQSQEDRTKVRVAYQMKIKIAMENEGKQPISAAGPGE